VIFAEHLQKNLPHIHCGKCSASPENIKEIPQAESRWLGYDIVLYKCLICGFEYKKEIL